MGVLTVTGSIGSAARNSLDNKVIQKLYRALLLSPNPKRDRAMLHLFLNFGCSINDIINLKEEDVDLVNGLIYWAKDGQRICSPLPAEILPDLVDYVRRERRTHCDRFFVTRIGHPMKKAHVQRVFAFLQREANVVVTPESLRQRHYQLIRQTKTVPALVALRRYLPYIVNASVSGYK